MNDHLYFIPIIEKALENKTNRKLALEKAFEQIELLGKQDNYKTGYRQFCMFMHQIGVSMQDTSPRLLERKLTEYFDRPNSLSITLEKDGVALETFRFTFAGGTKTLKNVIPGNYRLTLDTGLCIWSGLLTEANLLFSKGAGGDTLKMAADSHEIGPEPARTESLFDGMIRLCLYAGFNSGTMEITIKNIRI